MTEEKLGEVYKPTYKSQVTFNLMIPRMLESKNKIRRLILEDTDINDISGIAQLNLTHLNLALSDIRIIPYFPNLIELDISYCEKLTELDLRYRNIKINNDNGKFVGIPTQKLFKTYAANVIKRFYVKYSRIRRFKIAKELNKFLYNDITGVLLKY